MTGSRREALPQSVRTLKARRRARLAILMVPTLPAIAPLQAMASEAPPGVAASEIPSPAEPPPEDGDAADIGLLGDWLGLKPMLRDKAIDAAARFDAQSAYNAAGGDRHHLRTATQFSLALDADLDRMIALNGGRLHVTIAKRGGGKLEDAAGFQSLQQVQEIYGRGDIWRLTEAWYEQPVGKVEVRLGRLPTSSDFAVFACDFQNLAFCGPQPGNTVTDYWYNWPIGQWGARLRYDVRPDLHVQVGGYLLNARNAAPHNGFSLDDPFKASGTIFPVEFAWTPRWGPLDLAGSYKLGLWYATQKASDLRLDPGAPASRRRGRYGGYVVLEQEVFRPRPGRTVSIFFRGTKADDRTSVQDGGISMGVVWKGISRGRPADWIGAAYGISWLSGAFRDSGAPLSAGRGTERRAEIFYNLEVARWLWIRPNVQVVDQPGGFKSAPAAVVLGLKTGTVF